jgi:hypothetical protein
MSSFPEDPPCPGCRARIPDKYRNLERVPCQSCWGYELITNRIVLDLLPVSETQWSEPVVQQHCAPRWEPVLPTRPTEQTPPIGRGRKLSVDEASASVTLMGKTFTGLDPDAVRVLKVIAEAAPNRISRAEVAQKTLISRPERPLALLPPDIRALVHSGKGIRGYLLVLPACREEVES